MNQIFMVWSRNTAERRRISKASYSGDSVAAEFFRFVDLIENKFRSIFIFNDNYRFEVCPRICCGARSRNYRSRDIRQVLAVRLGQITRRRVIDFTYLLVDCSVTYNNIILMNRNETCAMVRNYVHALGSLYRICHFDCLGLVSVLTYAGF